MSLFPVTGFPPLVHIHSTSIEALGSNQFYILKGLDFFSGVASAAYPTANKALFVPFSVGKTVTIQNAFCYNGATASGNVDIGIYDIGGNKLVSTGTTAQAGTSVLQTISLTSTVLPIGNYYMAIAMDNTTGTLFRYTTADVALDKSFGMAEMASAFVLPATATLATITVAYIPIFGISTRSVI